MEQNVEVNESGSGYLRLIIERGVSQIALRRFSNWDTVGRRATTGSTVRWDIDFYDYVASLTQNSLFDTVVMITILLNTLFMALETDYDFKYSLFGFFEITDDLCIAIYTMEFLMKVYVEPSLYWKNGYNVFDAVILMVSYFPFFAGDEQANSLASSSFRVFSACRTLRVLKTVSFIRGLQALIEALFKTMKSVIYVLSLMFLLMFIFAIIGLYSYGDPHTGDPQNWGDLGSALFTLFSLVTVDGWTDLQQNLDNLGMTSSRIFTIVFILLGYFLFFSMFIGVVIMEIQHATNRFEGEVQNEREVSLTLKKHMMIQRQKKEIRQLIQSQTGNERNFNNLMEKFKKSLRHSDYMLMEDLCTSMSFIDIYLATLDHNDNTVNKLQQLYSEVVLVLCQLLEEDLVEVQLEGWREKNIKAKKIA